jgi:hypothetical protein
MKNNESQMGAKTTNEIGANGGRIGYMPNGDKVEWVTYEVENGEPEVWPLLLRRNDNAIRKTYRKIHDKVWYNQHQNWLHRIKTGEETLTEEQRPILEKAKKTAKRIEKKYGKENLGIKNLGLLSGRMSALAWVMGADWDDSLAT